MSEGVLPRVETGKGWTWLGLRTRVVLTWSAVLAVIFLAGSGFMIRNAWEERRILMERASAASLATANAFEREAAGTGYLLKGLSRSPALLSGDLRGFHDQLLTTPKPEGAWFALWNLDRQLLNTLRPFDAPLPARSDFEGTPESRQASLRRIRERGLSVSNRTRGVVAGRDVVAISLRLDGPDGEMNGFLSTVLPLARLNAIAREAGLPAGWKAFILDRNLVPVAGGDGEAGQSPGIPSEVVERIRMQGGSGLFFGRDATGDVLVAYHRLPAPEFTALTTVPLTLVNAPVAEATFRITLVGAGLTLLGALAGLLVRRQIEPVETLRTAVAASESKLQWAEAEIEHGRRLLQRVVETSPDVIYVFDVQGHRNVFLGGQVEEVLGYGPEEVRGMGDEVLAQLVHPDDLPRVMEHVARLVNLRDREVATVEYRMRDAAGHYRWLRSKETAFSRDSDGRVDRVIGVATETSAMKAAEAKILHVNERLRSILASVSDCYLTLDHAYRITDVNGAAEHWIGLDRGQVLGACLWDLCDPGAECSQAIREGMEQRQGIRREAESGLRPGRWIDLHVYPSAEGLSVFFSDVTDRRSVEVEVERARGLLQSALDALEAHVAILDDTGTIIAVNDAWRRFAAENGYDDAECGVGRNYLAACTGVGAAGEINEGLEAVLSGQRSGLRTLYACPGTDKVRWYQMRATRFLAGADIRMIVAHEDITEAVTARAAVDELSGRLLRLQDEERRRIAEELHDSTTQHLVAVSLNLMRLQKHVTGAEGRRLLDEAADCGDEAAKELRAFTYLLHPPSLENGGLAGTVREFAKGFTRRTGLVTTVAVPEEADGLPFDLQRSLLRVIQEAFTNTYRHAAASRVTVDLRFTADAVRLRILDDGRGLAGAVRDASREGALLGVGIAGMRARLLQFGGSLRLLSGRRGTMVVASLPITARFAGETAREIVQGISGFPPSSSAAPNA